jgi:VanZ family protein
VTAVILWGTLWPTVSTPTVNITFSDKLWHVLAFWIWAGVVALGWPSLGWKALAGAALIGAMIELVQPLVGREAELADLGADLLGAFLGVWSARRLLRRVATWRSSSGTSPQTAAERQSGAAS